MSVRTALRKLQRAFSAKDERAFDEAVEELEDKMEDHRGKDEGEEDPDTVEIHNHIPDSRDGIGEMVSRESEGELRARDPSGEHEIYSSVDRRDRRASDEEPEWFKKFSSDCMSNMDRMARDIESLQKWAREEEDEPEHQEDRRSDDRRDRRDSGNLENLGEYAEHDDGEAENLEMDRRSDDRHQDDRRSDDRRDRSRDRRDRRSRDDEPNKAILGELEFEAPPGTGDKARRARDSQYLEDSFQDVVSKAEIMAPGIRIPTFDHRAAPLRTARAIFGLRATALDLAYHQPESRGVIDAALGGRTLDTKRMSYGQTRVLFNSVAAVMASNNNRRATDRGVGSDAHAVTSGNIRSLGDINARNRALREGRKAS